MPVTRSFVSVLVAALCACGPDVGPSAGSGTGDGTGDSSESSSGEPEFDADWFLGRWSTGRPEQYGKRGVTYLDVEPDGTLMMSGLGDCGKSSGEPTKLLWRPSGVDSVVLTELDGTPYGSDDRSYHLVFLDVCNTAGWEFLDRVLVRDGEEIKHHEGTYVRGSICLQELEPPDDPDVVEYDDCRTEWCEGSPPEPVPCISD